MFSTNLFIQLHLVLQSRSNFNMSSNSDDTSNTSSQASKKFQRKNFSDEFDQLFNVEVSKGLWVAVHKSKSSQGSMFVDIRRKKEGTWKGTKIFIPSQQGLFLKYPEYECLKAELELFLAERKWNFEISKISKRTLVGKGTLGSEKMEIILKTEYKESHLTLYRQEIEKLVAHSVADGIASAMCQAMYD